MYRLSQGQLLLHLLSEEGETNLDEGQLWLPIYLRQTSVSGMPAKTEVYKYRSESVDTITDRSVFVFFSPLQDWKDHQHICCQSSGGVVHEDEPITNMDMDKVK